VGLIELCPGDHGPVLSCNYCGRSYPANVGRVAIREMYRREIDLLCDRYADDDCETPPPLSMEQYERLYQGAPGSPADEFGYTQELE
jgi:hypothetical protein